ncbi:MAG TPA: M56 family metallopeptidase [Sphingomicrobium sp.]|nr:M56 family metallopeptidase [Sphingomicrobium sp.]
MSWLVSNAIIASVLIIVVLLVRRPVAHYFGARAAYALWLAPAIRLVLPPLPTPIVAPSPGGEAVAWVLETGRNVAETTSILPSLWLLWAIGFCGMLTVRLVAHHRFLNGALADGRPYETPGIKYDVVATPAVDGPVATGLIHPLILVPQDFATRFTPEQQHFALWHEQLHHRRGDLWAAAAALVTTSILWFNPFAHLALGAFRRDMESACDASLLSSAGRAAAPAYAETILRCAARPVPRSLCALTSIDELKGRLKMLSFNHGNVAKFAGLLIAGGLVVAGTIAVPALAGEAKPTTQTTEIRKVIHNGPGKPGDGEAMMKSCPGEVIEVSADGAATAERKETQKIKLCIKAGSKAETATRLEQVIADIDKNEMDAAVKAELKAKLTAKIAELRAGN